MIYEENGVKWLEHEGKKMKMTCPYFYDITDEEYENLVREYYAKPTLEEVDENIRSISYGGTNKGALNRYYINDILSETTLYDAVWSPAEALRSKEVVGYILRYVNVNKKVYDPKDGLLSHLNKSMQLIGAGVCKKAGMFPMQTVDLVLDKYNVNDNYYDFSCGWGDRLIGSLRNHINYYGTDPNYKLVERLAEMGQRYLRVTNDTRTTFKIWTTGSEERHPEIENKMGLCFSSPPYFNLEDYKTGNQSWKPGVEYKDWLNGYMVKTMENCMAYLIDGGYFILNIKNFSDYDLVGDTKKLALEVGFKKVEQDKVVGRSQRTKIRKNEDDRNKLVDNVEGIMVFCKNPEHRKVYKLF